MEADITSPPHMQCQKKMCKSTDGEAATAATAVVAIESPLHTRHSAWKQMKNRDAPVGNDVQFICRMLIIELYD